MGDVLLAPDGTLASLDGPPVADPLGCLGHAVRLDGGCTLRSFFAMLRRYEVLLRLGDFFPAALAEAEACPASGCVTPLLSFLELRKTVSLIGYPGEPRIEVQTAFHGVAGGEPQELRFYSYEALLDLPLRLGRLRHMVLGDAVSVLECETAYGLFEVIEGVAWELGFHHVPKPCTLRR